MFKVYRYILVAAVLAGVHHLHAQNLVVNPGFESYNTCPTDVGQINASPGYDSFFTVIDWVNPLQNTTPDYFNTCSTAPNMVIPSNPVNGYQQPRSGNAFVAMSMFTGKVHNPTADDWQEYVETKLSSPLQAGHDYYISYFVNLACHAEASYNIISVDKLGARLSVDMIDTLIPPGTSVFKLDLASGITSPPGVFFSDTVGWTRVSGIYHATGGEQWLTIGRFNDSSSPVMYKLLRPTTGGVDSTHSTCYMNVDDVCVMDLANFTTTDSIVHTPFFPILIGSNDQADEYLWSTGDTTATINIPAHGTYWRQVWKDCAYTIDTFHVEESSINSCLWMPTAFTPNNDGRNDLFGPENYCNTSFSFFSFSIYDRWGQRIFNSNDPKEKWDGKRGSVAQDPDVYFYMLRYSLPTTQITTTGSGGSSPGNPGFYHPVGEEIHTISGNVTLIR